jgi:hypothetical protein
VFRNPGIQNVEQAAGSHDVPGCLGHEGTRAGDCPRDAVESVRGRRQTAADIGFDLRQRARGGRAVPRALEPDARGGDDPACGEANSNDSSERSTTLRSDARGSHAEGQNTRVYSEID